MTAALEGGEWSAARPGRTVHPERPGTHLQEAGWAPGPVWTGAENLVPTGIRSRNVQPGSSVAILTELPGPQQVKPTIP